MTQHNWDVQGPRPEREQGPIDPSQWRIEHGVALPAVPTYKTAEQINKRDNETEYYTTRASVLRKIREKEHTSVTLGELRILSNGNLAIAKRIEKFLRKPEIEQLDSSKTIDAVMLDDWLEPLLKGSLMASLATLKNIGDLDRPIADQEAEDEWVDEVDTLEGQRVGNANGLDRERDPDLDNPEAGPSSPPPRPCNADPAGFEKEVSYAAPELIGSESQKGKEREVLEYRSPFTEAQTIPAAADQPRPSTTLRPQMDAEPSRNQSFSTLPSQSDGSEKDDLSPPGQIVELPVEDVADPPAAVVDLAVPQEVIDAIQQGGDPFRRPERPPPDFQDPDDAALELDDWDGIFEGMCMSATVRSEPVLTCASGRTYRSNPESHTECEYFLFRLVPVCQLTCNR